MKNFFLAVTLLALLLVGSRGVQAQAYGPYYGPHWDFQIPRSQGAVGPLPRLAGPPQATIRR